jgi:hypothetical protein
MDGYPDLATGYLSGAYAESLSEFGVPRELPRSRGWILQRPIPGSSCYDAMGCYPLFACQDWSQLHHDLERLGNDLVALSLVTDPFGEYDLSYLERCFDMVLPFKEHFVIDLHQPVINSASKHHQYYARKSLQKVHVEPCPEPEQLLDEWMQLYDTLIEKHNLKGIRAFSRAAFARQLSVPRSLVFRAVREGVTVGMDWYYMQGEVGYGHLAAFSPDGYRLAASYALQWTAIEHLSKEARWLDIGAGAGAESNGTDGLSLFKRGWTTETRTAFFCGRIFDQKKYCQIVKTRGVGATLYFPAYRADEFD